MLLTSPATRLAQLTLAVLYVPGHTETGAKLGTAPTLPITILLLGAMNALMWSRLVLLIVPNVPIVALCIRRRALRGRPVGILIRSVDELTHPSLKLQNRLLLSPCPLSMTLFG